jgi:hypothetical protein
MDHPHGCAGWGPATRIAGAMPPWWAPVTGAWVAVATRNPEHLSSPTCAGIWDTAGQRDCAHNGTAPGAAHAESTQGL